MKKRFIYNVCTILVASCLTSCGCSPKHEHNYSIDKFDEANHWKECECGEKSEITQHSFTNKNDASYHWKECSCGYSTPKLNHTIEQKRNDTQHWTECADCEYVSEKVNHTLFPRCDDNNHWQECDCGFSTTKEAHTLEDKFDNAQHWQACSDCDYEKGRANHELENQCDFYNHWMGCKNCEYDGEKTIHYYQVNYDDDYHWQECSSCGNKVEKDTHSFTLRHDAEHHWQGCPCGYKKDMSEHNFGEYIEDSPATCKEVAQGHYVCSDCGEVKNVVGELGTHEYEEQVTREASATQCGIKKYTCKYCNDTYEESIPHLGEHIFSDGYYSCGSQGHAHKCTCYGCETFEESNIYNHNMRVTIIDREPDGENPGHEHLKCKTCDYVDPDSERDFYGTPITNIELSKVLPVVGEAFNSEVLCLSEGIELKNNLGKIVKMKDYYNGEIKSNTYVVQSTDVGSTFRVAFAIKPDNNHYFRYDPITHAPLVTCTLNGIPIRCPAGLDSRDSDLYWGFNYDYVIPECVHDWQLISTSIEPTDTSMGEGTYKCSKCKDTKVDLIPHTGNHKPTNLVVNNVNYGTQYVCYNDEKCGCKCSIEGCPEYYLTKNHNLSKYCIDVESDGVNPGTKHKVCSDCGYQALDTAEEFTSIQIPKVEISFKFPKAGQQFSAGETTINTTGITQLFPSVFSMTNGIQVKINNQDLPSGGSVNYPKVKSGDVIKYWWEFTLNDGYYFSSGEDGNVSVPFEVNGQQGYNGFKNSNYFLFQFDYTVA